MAIPSSLLYKLLYKTDPSRSQQILHMSALLSNGFFSYIVGKIVMKDTSNFIMNVSCSDESNFYSIKRIGYRIIYRIVFL